MLEDNKKHNYVRELCSASNIRLVGDKIKIIGFYKNFDWKLRRYHNLFYNVVQKQHVAVDHIHILLKTKFKSNAW